MFMLDILLGKTELNPVGWLLIVFLLLEHETLVLGA